MGRCTERYEFIFCIVKASTLPSNHPDTKAMQLASPTSAFCPGQRHFPMHGISPTVSHKSMRLAGEIESKAFQHNNLPETT